MPGADVAILDEFKKQGEHRRGMEARSSGAEAYAIRVISTGVGMFPILTVLAGTAVAVWTDVWWAGVLLVAGTFVFETRRKVRAANADLEDSSDEPEDR